MLCNPTKMLSLALIVVLLSAPFFALAHPRHGRNLQARAVSPDFTCGGAVGYTCPDSASCCSHYNWCGSTDAYCGAGCQAAFGTCSGGGGGSTTSQPPTSSTSSPPPPPSSGSISPDMTCGGSAGYTCPGSDPCCSQYGWCGSTDGYCGAGCQASFGTCSAGGGTTTSTQPPGSTSTGGTASIPRPKIGSVPYGSVIYSCIYPGDIAITFDDGPYIYTPDLLDLLARYNTKATFFIV
jgi:hypothetical protein